MSKPYKPAVEKGLMQKKPLPFCYLTYTRIFSILSFLHLHHSFSCNTYFPYLITPHISMATREEYLSPEIVNRGINESGPYAGSPNFSVRVHRGLPDFLSSVNLEYVRLGYSYLISHGGYVVGFPILLAIFGTQVGRLITMDIFSLECYNLVNIVMLLGFLCLFVYVYLDLTPRSTYLVDFACYLPPKELKVCVLARYPFGFDGF